MTNISAKSTPLILGFGEALFDVVDGDAILGGAPCNFAVHAQQMLATGTGANVGGQAIPVSCVGDDALGRRLRSEVATREVNVDYLQVDATLPTGTVEVELNAEGHPTYDICQGVAWDGIAFTPELAELGARADAICYGTLVQRTAGSRGTLRSLLEAAMPQAARVCDLNLRAPHYTPEVVEESLRWATVLKLNDDELAIVAKMFELAAPAGDLPATIEALAGRFPQLTTIAVTEGAAGARLWHGGKHFSAEPPRCERVAGADSIGAGDSWCAALVIGLLRGLPPQQILGWANRVASFVASQRGATPTLPGVLLSPSA
ncbi:PfkB family carbohydrate kinase [Lacipirellula limnantheis]|uniref:Ribokinase n=1 Tax=Lacipirellula limnantheis TaxID=2528024 RepID=A0A517TXC8_9BACT|nr:PfkB family carbohydrate kinase [Lacipirellula limnantheis]QDT73036.1 Ribokinase [Lacipirellula limnantheis]